MTRNETTVPLPSDWPRHVQAAVLHVISLARLAFIGARGRAASSRKSHARMRSDLEALREEIALLRREIEIKDLRMSRIHTRRSRTIDPSSAWRSSASDSTTWEGSLYELRTAGELLPVDPGESSHGQDAGAAEEVASLASALHGGFLIAGSGVALLLSRAPGIVADLPSGALIRAKDMDLWTSRRSSRFRGSSGDRALDGGIHFGSNAPGCGFCTKALPCLRYQGAASRVSMPQRVKRSRAPSSRRGVRVRPGGRVRVGHRRQQAQDLQGR